MKWLQQQWFYITHQPLDKGILLPSLALMIIGFVMISSASMDVSAVVEEDPYHYSKRQAMYLLMGVLVVLVSALIPTSFWQRNSVALMALSALLLFIVLIPGVGKEVNGSSRWLAIGSFSLQPSEFAKIGVVIFTAGYLVRRQAEVRSTLVGFIKAMVILSVFNVLLLLEPDFGATLVLMGAVVGMFFLGGMRKRHLFSVTLVLVPVAALLAFLAPYRMQRLTTFLEPWSDPFGAGYQLTQAQIAFGRGGWFGEGLGNSMQKLFYLPEAHTDFIYSVLAEEWGAIGALVVVFLYGVLVKRGLKVGEIAESLDRYYAAYLTYGLVLIIAAQATANIGVNLGLLPTKGLTLPFVSYGGSSIIACTGILGILLRISMDNTAELTKRNRMQIDNESYQVNNEELGQVNFMNEEAASDQIYSR